MLQQCRRVDRTRTILRTPGAIHIYGGDFFAVPRSEFDAETLEERPYDVEKAKRVFLDANDRLQSVPNTSQ